MSNYGQAALTIVGTVVGTYFGYPQLGFVLGSLAGQAIFPTKLPGVNGPRLQDQRTTTATVGAPVADIIGTDAVGGNVIWMEVPAREVGTTEELGGKGGPTQSSTTYTYYQSIAIGICRGPKLGLLQIMENGKLVYDVREQQEGEADAAYSKRIEAALAYAEGFTLYLGDETQMPDPTIELHKGVGNVPGYRGLCYIVFHDRQLLAEQGLRQPAYKFVVSDSFVGACDLEFSNEVLHDWLEGGLDPSNPLNLNTYKVVQTGNNSFRPDDEDFDCNLPTEYPTMSAALAAATVEMGRSFGIVGYAMNPADTHWGDPGLLAQMGGYSANEFNRTYAYAHANAFPIGGSLVFDPDGPAGVLQLDAAFPAHDQIVYMDHYFTNAGCGGLGGTFMFVAELEGGGTPPAPPGWDFLVAGPGGGWAVSTDALIEIKRVPGAPSADGWTLHEGHLFRVMRQYNETGGPDDGPIAPLNPCVPFGDPDFADQAFWEAAYAQAVTDGTMEAGLVYEDDYPIEQTWAYVRGGTPIFDMEAGHYEPWNLSAADPRNVLNQHTYTGEIVGAGEGTYDTLAELMANLYYQGDPAVIYGGIRSYGKTPDRRWAPYAEDPSDELNDNPTTINLSYARYPSVVTVTEVIQDGISIVDFVIGHGGAVNPFWWHGAREDETSGYGTGTWGWVEHSADIPELAGGSFAGDGDSAVWVIYDLYVVVRRVPGPPVDDGMGAYLLEESRNWRWLSNENTVGNQVTQNPTGPGRPDGHPQATLEDYWTPLYEAARDADQLPPGLVYNVNYPNGSNHGYVRIRCTLGGGPVGMVSLAEIIRRICARALIGEDEIVVTDLEDVEVTGYTLGRVMAARDAVDPLRNVGFFDIIESGELIVFRKRGGAIDHTLTTRDLGVRESGGAAVPAVKTRRLDETTLPRRIFIHHRDPARDFEDGEQISPARSTALTVNDVHLEVSIAMSGSLAAKSAEIIWADAWEASTTHEVQVGGDLSLLEPGDVLELPVDGFLERTRITEADESIAILRRLLLTRDYDGSYVSVAVADPPERTPGEMLILGPSEILFLDIPALRETDNEPGVYAVTRPVDPGDTWRGATIYRSEDEGVSFTAIAGTSTEPTTGEVQTPLPAGATDTWDWTYALRVTLRTGEFETRTRAAVIGGANLIAVGAHGRWELIHFLQAVQVDPDTFDLKGLARGRRGTAHLMGSGQEGDTVVLVSGTGVIRLPMPEDFIDVPKLYKAVTFDMAYATGTDSTFATHGEALRPFSPVRLEVETDEDGNWTISWLRRDRLSRTLMGGPLPLSDVPEAYEIDIERLGSPAVVERTLSSATDSVTYTAAQQADDFGEDPTPIRIRVHQLNPIYGRGPGTELVVGIEANEGGLGALEFVADYDDKPNLIGVANGRFLFTRIGKLASTPVVGFYGWTGTDPAPVIDTDYDARGIQYVPSSYFAGAVIGSGVGAVPPRFADPSTDRWGVYYRRNPGSEGTHRELLISGNGAAELVVANPTEPPLASSTFDIIAVHARAGGYHAITAQVGIVGSNVPKSYSSADGETWTLEGDTTGLPIFTSLTVGEFFEFDGDTYLWCSFGPYKSTEPTLKDYDDTGVTNLLAEYNTIVGGGAQGFYFDFAVSATAIIVVMQAGTGDLGAVDRRNLILRSTDGENWSATRNVLQSSDIAPGYAFQLEWLVAVPLGAGFAVFGKAKDAFAFPYVTLSTDDGATWSTPAPVDTGDPFSNAVIMAAISDGTTILAIDTLGRRQMNPDGTYNPAADPVVYGRLSTSTDGLTFSALPGFPVE